jgi:hypothetical protein
MQNNDFEKNVDNKNINELFIKIPTDNHKLCESKNHEDPDYDMIDDLVFNKKENSSDTKRLNEPLDFGIIHLDIKENINHLNGNNTGITSRLSKNSFNEFSCVADQIEKKQNDEKKNINNVSTFLVDNSLLTCERKIEIVDNKKLLITLSDLEKSINKLSTNETNQKPEMHDIQSSHDSNRIFGNFDDNRNSLNSFLNNWWKPTFRRKDNTDPNNQFSHEAENKKKLNIDFSIFQREVEKNQEKSNEILQSSTNFRSFEKGKE